MQHNIHWRNNIDIQTSSGAVWLHQNAKNPWRYHEREKAVLLIRFGFTCSLRLDNSKKHAK